jgi:antitoxin MazE
VGCWPIQPLKVARAAHHAHQFHAVQDWPIDDDVTPRIYSYSLYIYAGNAMQVSKWGNSLAVRLPAAVVEALGLKEGDQVEIQVAGKKTFEVTRAPSARELLARLRKFRGRLPASFKFDRLEANERR